MKKLLATILLLVYSSVWAVNMPVIIVKPPVAFNAANDAFSSGSSSTATCTITIGALDNGLLLIQPLWGGAANVRTVSSVTYDGSATGVTQLSGAAIAGTAAGGVVKMGADVWYKVLGNVSAGSHTVVITWNGATFTGCVLSSWSNVDQSTPLNPTVSTNFSSSGGSPVTAGSVTIPVGGAGVAGMASDQSFSYSASQTNIYNNIFVFGTGDYGGQYLTTSGARNFTWTLGGGGGDGWVSNAVTINKVP